MRGFFRISSLSLSLSFKFLSPSSSFSSSSFCSSLAGSSSVRKLYMSSSSTSTTTTAAATGTAATGPHAAEEDSVLFHTEGGKAATYTLNRPKALNALNLDMVQKLQKHLTQWQSHPYVTVIMARGAGAKAFCAGGDVRAIAEAGKAKDPLSFDFFQNEYMVNHLIGVSQKPVVSFIDGITMGGGVGLSVHGHFRVATEKTVFAMPETGIGLFPDVGGSFFLPRLDGQLGMFLALTGYRLKGSDVLMAGIATHYILSSDVSRAVERIHSLHSHTSTLYAHKQEDSIDYILDPIIIGAALDELCAPIAPFSLSPHRGVIDRCFSKPSVEDILKALDEEAKANNNAFAEEAASTMRRMSPTSLKVTFQQIRRGAERSFKECFRMELGMTQEVMGQKDFYEGIRAVLVDKDQKPKWEPSTLGEVTDQMVAAYFPSATPEIPFLSDRDHYQYPHASLGLPSEKAIREAVQLAPMDMEHLMAHLSDETQKAGLREKVADVVSRCCAVDSKGVIRWNDASSTTGTPGKL